MTKYCILVQNINIIYHVCYQYNLRFYFSANHMSEVQSPPGYLIKNVKILIVSK